MEPTDTLSVLIIGADTKSGSAFAHNMQALIDHLKADDMQVISVDSFEGLKDGFIANGAMADCVLIDWNAPSAEELIKLVREQNKYVSIFLLTEPGDLSKIPVEVFPTIDEYAWILGDTPEFIAGRIKSAARKYRRSANSSTNFTENRPSGPISPSPLENSAVFLTTQAPSGPPKSTPQRSLVPT